MSTTHSMKLLALTALLVAITGGPTFAENYLIQDGEDTAPYSFISTLPRHTSPTLYAYTAEPDENNFSHNFEAYIRFTIPPNLISEDEQISSASFFITYAFNFTGYGDTSSDPGELRCYEILESWNQATLTWSNRPNAGGDDDDFDRVTGIDSFQVMTCDATDLVRDWITGAKANNGIALKSPTPRVLGMNSFEAAVPAALKANLSITTVAVEAIPSISPIGALALTSLLSIVGFRFLTKKEEKL